MEVGLETATVMKQTMANYNPPSLLPIPTKLRGKGSLLKSLVRLLVIPRFVRTISSEALKLFDSNWNGGA